MKMKLTDRLIATHMGFMARGRVNSLPEGVEVEGHRRTLPPECNTHGWGVVDPPQRVLQTYMSSRGPSPTGMGDRKAISRFICMCFRSLKF